MRALRATHAREGAAADDGVAAITVLPDQTLGDRCGIVLEIDAIGPRHSEIIMMDERIVTEAHLTRDGFRQRDEFVS